MNPKLKKILKLGGLTILVVLVAATLGGSWYMADMLISAPMAKRGDPCQVSDRFCEANVIEKLQLSPAEFSISAAGGVQLSGLYLPSKNGAAVIVQHGYRGARTNVLHIAAMLHEGGYGVIAMDMRSHGKSGGDEIGFGRDEVADMRLVVDFLAQKQEVDPERIGIYGWSLGAAVALMSSADNPALKAVIADCPFDAINGMNVAEFTDLPKPFASLIVIMMGLQLGVDFQEISPLNNIQKIAPRPILFMIAEADKVVDPQSGHNLYAAAEDPKQQWVEAELQHVMFSIKKPEQFKQRMLDFFGQHLN